MFYTGFVDEEFIPKQAPDASWLKIMAEAIAEVTPILKPDESFMWMNHKLPSPEKKLNWTQRVEFWGGFHKGVKGFFLNEAGRIERICVYPIHDRRHVIPHLYRPAFRTTHARFQVAVTGGGRGHLDGELERRGAIGERLRVPTERRWRSRSRVPSGPPTVESRRRWSGARPSAPCS